MCGMQRTYKAIRGQRNTLNLNFWKQQKTTTSNCGDAMEWLT